MELGSRALEILIALVRRAGELVGKDELIAAAWPDTKVEEVNLRVHVSALRRALGDGRPGRRYLLTMPGRGDRFVGLVTRPTDGPMIGQHPAPAAGRGLPAPPARLIGRDDMVQTILAQLQQRRSVTIVGPGGIGKTAIAIKVADTLQASFSDSACFVELSLVSGNDLAAGAIAIALGLSLHSGDTGPGVLAFLRSKRLLLVPDSGERVVDGVGALVERVLKEAPGVHVLATSREPLHAESERVLRLPPLRIPPIAAGPSTSEIIDYPAVQLLVERAAAALDGFVLTDADAPVVGDICVRLDGIALAIELVAGHVAAFDLQTLNALLDDRFRLLARGHRGASPRHQTMSTVLDWSYQTITEPERILLRRLAVFDGAAPLTAIRDVAGGAGLPTGDVAATLAGLVDKSLVVIRPEARQVFYHLLDTTRAYALERLIENGEQADVSRRHARQYMTAFARAGMERPAQTSAEWLGIHGREIGNARAALAWAFSPEGDAMMGRATLARVLWLLGEPGREWDMARQTLAAAVAQDHAISQGYVLLEAALPLAFMLRDRDAAGQGIKLLGELAEQNGLAIWKAAVRVLRLAAQLVSGSVVPASMLRESLADLSATDTRPTMAGCPA